MRHLLYALYERRLLRQVSGRAVPRHVGLILDGNRRYARDRGLPDPLDAYGHGAEKLDNLLKWCRQLGIPAVTLWVFSTENFHRPAAEIAGILGAVESKLSRLAADRRVARLGVRLRAVGRLELLPDSTLAAIRAAEAATATHEALTLTVAIAYGGREEIADAVRALPRERVKQGEGLAEVVESVTPEAIGRYLYAPDLPDPDLIIRTSGEVRLSGFLLGQSAYSEFTSVTSTGRPSGRSTSCGLYVRIRIVTAALGGDADRRPYWRRLPSHARTPSRPAASNARFYQRAWSSSRARVTTHSLTPRPRISLTSNRKPL